MLLAISKQRGFPRDVKSRNHHPVLPWPSTSYSLPTVCVGSTCEWVNGWIPVTQIPCIMWVAEFGRADRKHLRRIWPLLTTSAATMFQNTAIAHLDYSSSLLTELPAPLLQSVLHPAAKGILWTHAGDLLSYLPVVSPSFRGMATSYCGLPVLPDLALCSLSDLFPSLRLLQAHARQAPCLRDFVFAVPFA